MVCRVSCVLPCTPCVGTRGALRTPTHVATTGHPFKFASQLKVELLGGSLVTPGLTSCTAAQVLPNAFKHEFHPRTRCSPRPPPGRPKAFRKPKSESPLQSLVEGLHTSTQWLSNPALGMTRQPGQTHQPHSTRTASCPAWHDALHAWRMLEGQPQPQGKHTHFRCKHWVSLLASPIHLQHQPRPQQLLQPVQCPHLLPPLRPLRQQLATAQQLHTLQLRQHGLQRQRHAGIDP